MGAPVWFLEQTAALRTELSLSVGEAADGPELVNGVLCCGGAPLSLRDVTAVYVRAMDFRLLPAFADLRHNSPERFHAMALEDLLVAWLEMTQARVVNRPSAMGPNNSKPYQAAQLRALGFATPRTLVTTEFPGRSPLPRPPPPSYLQRRKRGPQYRFTAARRRRQLHGSDGRRRELSYPISEYIPGDEYRVHTVGSQVFASQVLPTPMTTATPNAAIPEQKSARRSALGPGFPLHPCFSCPESLGCWL